MKEITKAQEDLLKALWEIKEGAISDVLDSLDDPKPAYNTVATVIKVLEKKGYVSHKTYGKTHVYFAVVSKKDYAQHLMKDTFKGLIQWFFEPDGLFLCKKQGCQPPRTGGIKGNA